MGNKYARLIGLAVPLGILAALLGLVIGGSIEQVEAGLPIPVRSSATDSRSRAPCRT